MAMFMRSVTCQNYFCLKSYLQVNTSLINNICLHFKKYSVVIICAKMVVPTIKLNNGYDIPAFGLGTYDLKGSKGIESIKHAIDAGYRHFDTAYLYDTEQEVGTAIKQKIAEGIVTREECFVVTKLWCTYHEPELVERICRKSLENLGLEYIDLYLMHFPVGFIHINDNESWPKNKDGTQATNDIDYVDTWKAMEKLVKLGLVRSIGLSNFNSQQIERLMSAADIMPVNNQVECSPLLNQKKLIKFCADRNIVVTGYSPLGSGKSSCLNNSIVIDIAKKYKKKPPQIILKYLVEIGAVPIPKSITKERIDQNIDIFDFSLTEDDIKIMDTLHTGERNIKLSDAKHAKYWPFAIEF